MERSRNLEVVSRRIHLVIGFAALAGLSGCARRALLSPPSFHSTKPAQHLAVSQQIPVLINPSWRHSTLHASLPLSRRFSKLICRSACVRRRCLLTLAPTRPSALERPLIELLQAPLPSPLLLPRPPPSSFPITAALHRKDFIVISSYRPASSIPRRSPALSTRQFVSPT